MRAAPIHLLSEVNANNLPGGRDIRDPKLGRDGRQAVSVRDQPPARASTTATSAVEAWTIRAESTDGGRTWTPPVRTYAGRRRHRSGDVLGLLALHETRSYTEAGEHRRDALRDRLPGLRHRGRPVRLRRRRHLGEALDDHRVVRRRAERGRAAVLRREPGHRGGAGRGSTTRTSWPTGRPRSARRTIRSTRWECGRRIEQRLGRARPGSSAARRGRVRSFVFARKHLPCTFKRTAIYELRGDLADPSAAIEVCEIQELMSSGDTAYTSLAPLDRESLAAGLVQQHRRSGAAVVPGHLLAERHLARRRRLSRGAGRLHAGTAAPAVPGAGPAAGQRHRPTSPARICSPRAPVIWPSRPACQLPSDDVRATAWRST